MDNALYKKISEGLAPIVKSVQRGVITFSDTKAITVTIDSIIPEKSIVIISGVTNNNTNNSSGTTAQPYIYSLKKTSVTLTPGVTAIAVYPIVSWQVIEFY